MTKPLTTLTLLTLFSNAFLTSALADTTTDHVSLQGFNNRNSHTSGFPSADPNKPHTGATLPLRDFNNRTMNIIFAPTDADKLRTGAVLSLQGFNGRDNSNPLIHR